VCVVKTPKVAAGSEKPKEPTIIRNPFLDGLNPETKALRKGRSTLRIERAGGRGVQSPPATAPIPTPSASPTTPALPQLPPVLPFIGRIGQGGSVKREAGRAAFR